MLSRIGLALLVTSAAALVLALTVAQMRDEVRRPAPTVAGHTATPVPTATPMTTGSGATAVVTLTPSPAPTATPAMPRTAEEAARQLGAALQASDWQLIRRLIAPTGFVAAWYQGEGTMAMTRDETIAFLRKRTPDGTIRARVTASSLEPCRGYHPCKDFQPRSGDMWIRSVWTAFDGKAEQNVHLVLHRDSSGFWYWSAMLLQAPD